MPFHSEHIRFMDKKKKLCTATQMVTGEAKEEVGSGNYDSVSGTETPKEEVEESNVDSDLESGSSHMQNVRTQYGYGGA